MKQEFNRVTLLVSPMATCFEKAFDSIASRGFSHPFGGSCFFGGSPIAAGGFKHELTVVFSAMSWATAVAGARMRRRNKDEVAITLESVTLLKAGAAGVAH